MGGKDASRLPFPLFHRRPISTPPLTHLSRMANWAPVYSPQQRNTERKEGRGGPTTSGNHQAKRALDPEIPVSDPSPLLNPPPPCLYSTPPPPPFLSICLPPSLLFSPPPPPPFSSSPPFVPAAHHFHVSSGSGPNPNRLSNCFKNILPFSDPSAPPLCPVFIPGNRHSLSWWRRCWCQSGLG